MREFIVVVFESGGLGTTERSIRASHLAITNNGELRLYCPYRCGDRVSDPEGHIVFSAPHARWAQIRDVEHCVTRRPVTTTEESPV